MSAVNSVSSAASPAASASSSALDSTASDLQNRFLKLLVTQLKNQDPLNPMDNAQMTSQMAQMSELQGIEKLNTTMSSLAASITGNQAIQAATLVGHGVMVPGNQMQLNNGQAVGGVNLSQAADSVKVTVSDASGQVIHTADLGPQPQGVVQITWDGATDAGAAAANGSYSFSVTATARGQPVTAQTLLVGGVVGVTAGPSGTTLDLGTQGKVSLSQVQQFL